MAAPPPVPSAGIIERELEKEYEAKPLEEEKQVPNIQIDIPQKTFDLPDDKKVYVHKILIEDNESILTKELNNVIKGYLNKEISLKDVYKLCHLIDMFYAKKGYFLARAYPPAQAINNHTLIIRVIEGKLGNISVVGNKHYKEGFIKSFFRPLKNKSLRYNDFLYALMLLNDNADLFAGAVFEKGKEFGTADVILQVKDSSPKHFYFNGNNYGRNLTTNSRVGGRLDYGNFVMQGDKFSIAEVIGFPVNALYFTDVIYNVLLNRKGASLELSYLFSRFTVEELTYLDLKGRSNIGTIKFNQAIMRSRNLSMDFFSYFDIKQIQNFVLSERTSFDKLRVLTIGTLLDHFNPNIGRDYLVLRLAGGIPNFLGGLKSVDSKCSRQGGGGRFFIFNMDYDHIQSLPYYSFLYFHSSLQLSPNKLALPEEIYIGGNVGTLSSPILVNCDDQIYAGAYGHSPSLADFNGSTIDNTINEITSNPPCIIIFNGVVIKNCQTTPAVVLPEFLSFDVPGFYSSYFNLASYYYFLTYFFDKNYVYKPVYIYYSTGKQSEKSKKNTYLSSLKQFFQKTYKRFFRPFG